MDGIKQAVIPQFLLDTCFKSVTAPWARWILQKLETDSCWLSLLGLASGVRRYSCQLSKSIIFNSFVKNYVLVYIHCGVCFLVMGFIAPNRFSKMFVRHQVSRDSLLQYNTHNHGQLRRFNVSIVHSFCHYITNNRRKWDLHTITLTHPYKMQIQRLPGVPPPS